MTMRKPHACNIIVLDPIAFTTSLKIANTQTQMLIQEEKINVDIIKRIMSVKKTTLASLRNQDWGTVKSKTVKVNDLLKNFPTNEITGLNDLIYAAAKLVSGKIGVSLKTTDRNSD